MQELEVDQRLKIFFNDIDKYALKDLEKMLESADYNSEYQRLAVPIAQLCFSLLDIFGFLLTDFNGSKNRDASDEKKIKLSLDYIFGSELDENQKRCLVKVYRHGVVHSFFPKMAGICNSIENQQVISVYQGYINLNVNPFAKTIIYKLRNELGQMLSGKSYILSNFDYYINSATNDSTYYSSTISQTTTTTSSTSQTTLPSHVK